MAIAKLTIDLEARVANIERDMAKSTRAVERAAKRMEGAFGGVSSVLSALGPLATAAFAGFSVIGTIGKLTDVQRQFDILNASLITVTGNSTQAQKEFAWIKEFAATTPFDLAQVTEAFIKMKSLGLDASMEALASYGNTASAMGKSLNQMIEAVAHAATGEFERLKEFGIRASKEGDKVTLTFQGVSTTIRNSSAEISRYLADIGNNQFAGAMEERAKTLDGALSNLGDTWDDLFRTINEAGVGELIYDSVQLASRGVEQLISNIKVLQSYAAPRGQLGVDVLVGERNYLQEQLAGLQGRRGDVAATARADVERRIAAINDQIREFQEEFERREFESKLPPVTVTATPQGDGKKNKGKAPRSFEDYDAQVMQAVASAITDNDVTRAADLAAQIARLDSLYFDAGLSSDIYDAAMKKLTGSTSTFGDAQARLDALLGNSMAARLEKQREDMQLLADAFERGKITAEEFSDAAQSALGNFADDAEDKFADLKQSIEGFGRDAAGAIIDFALTGKSSFSDMVESMLADIAKMLIYQNVTKPLAGHIGNIFGPVKANADGGVYSSAGLSAYSGQVVSSPTIFPFAKGVGLMGEAGPEAILPLKRGSDGKLGVSAGASGVQVNVTINNQTGADVQQSSSMGADGTLNLEVMITERVKGRLIRETQQGAGLAPVLENKYGLNPAAGARR